MAEMRRSSNKKTASLYLLQCAHAAVPVTPSFDVILLAIDNEQEHIAATFPGVFLIWLFPPFLILLQTHTHAKTVAKLSQDLTVMRDRRSILNLVQKIRWANFTFSLSTGGIALVLGDLTHRFHGLNAIGVIFFFATIVIFLVLMSAAITRFCTSKDSLRDSVTKPPEVFFLAAVILTISTIILCMSKYGAPHTGYWMIVTLRILFWTYSAIALMQCTLSYLALFTLKTGLHLHLHSMTPIWLMPSVTLSLAGSIAASVAPLQPPTHAISIAIAGLTFQGIGFSLFLFECSLYVLRLSLHGLPEYEARPAMFLAVGPPSFAAYNLVDLGLSTDLFIGQLKGPLINPLLAKMLAVIATCFAIFFWGIALWLFFLAFLGNVSAIFRHRQTFHIAWWSFIFPNVGFVNATNAIGQALGSQAISWVVVGFALLLVSVYLVLLILLAILFFRVVSGKDDLILEEGKEDIKDAEQMEQGQIQGNLTSRESSII